PRGALRLGVAGRLRPRRGDRPSRARSDARPVVVALPAPIARRDPRSRPGTAGRGSRRVSELALAALGHPPLAGAVRSGPRAEPAPVGVASPAVAREVMRVGVVGLGAMGAGIAQLAVEAGFETVGHEVALARAEAARDRIAHF